MDGLVNEAWIRSNEEEGRHIQQIVGRGSGISQSNFSAIQERLYERRQILRILVAVEICSVLLCYVRIALVNVPAEVMPHEVIHSKLCDFSQSKVDEIPLLIEPFDPSSLLGCRIHQNQRIQSIRMIKLG